MRHYVGDGDDETEPPALPDAVLLPYPLATCMDLWNAWKEHGVMPARGGYFDQPRAWRRMVRLFNQVYNPISKAHLEALFPDKEAGDDIESLWAGGESVRSGWDEFAKE